MYNLFLQPFLINPFNTDSELPPTAGDSDSVDNFVENAPPGPEVVVKHEMRCLQL